MGINATRARPADALVDNATGGHPGLAIHEMALRYLLVAIPTGRPSGRRRGSDCDTLRRGGKALIVGR
jgi:hypothetical protein